MVKKNAKKKRAMRRKSGSLKNSKLLQVVFMKRRFWVLAGVILFCLGVVGIGILDLIIRSQFEGKKWSLPARVYARPLELYPELPLSALQLQQELKGLGYTSRLQGQGSYELHHNALSLHTRDFQFWDEQVSGKRLRLSFRGDVIEKVLDVQSGKPLQLARLDPIQIASIYPHHREDRDLVKLEQVPSLLIDTLLLVEDQDFYAHSGIRPLSIMRALLANIRAGAAVQGGSTLTQQLVKNFFLNNERSLKRKAIEAMMALLLEWHYSKQEILQTYLNEIYLGQEGERAIHGFGLASRFYFGQSINALSPGQIALLIALVKGPSHYDPRRNSQRALDRRNRVLSMMAREHLLSEEVAARARHEPLHVRDTQRSVFPYPAFVDLVRRQLQRDYRDEDLRTEGLRIFTTLDPLIQFEAEQALSTRLTKLENARKFPTGELQGALVMTHSNSGEVVALIGDRKPAYVGFNRALDAQRPIGSLIKPVIYLEALSHVGLYHAATLLDDSVFSFRDRRGILWQPENYDKVFHGHIPLYQGLVYSYNAATARLGMTLGLDPILQRLRQMGLDKPVLALPSVLLGALSLSPLEVTQVYQTFAANGFTMPLRAVREILTVDGVLLQRYPLNIKQIEGSDAVYILNGLLQKVVEIGTARAVGQALPVLRAAGKTGSSDHLRDSWFAGFTGEHLAVIWVGRDDNQPMQLTGATGALPVWIDVMSRVNSHPLHIKQPENVEWVRVEADTGYRSNGKCEKELELPFIMGSAPDQLAGCRSRSFWRRLFD